MRILIVEDDRKMAGILQEALEKQLHRTVLAFSGIEGLDVAYAFIQRKFTLHQMDNLTDELQEHSSLLPGGKLLRVRYVNGPLVYEAEAMKHLELSPPWIRTLRPTDVDTEVGAFAQEQIVRRVDQGVGEVISGRSVGRADGAESCD